MKSHRRSGALATLAVQQRESSRYLLFDREGRLCGRRIGTQDEVARPADNKQELAFCGIHVISPYMLPMMREEGVFSIVSRTWVSLLAERPLRRSAPTSTTGAI